MKALALALPLLVFAPILLLQRMEAWCARPARPPRMRPAPPVPVPPVPTPSTARITMARQITAPTPATDADVHEPLPRDPPLPPGYVDPLEGDPLLSDLRQEGRGADRPSADRSDHNG
jgi:hypothetical protein